MPKYHINPKSGNPGVCKAKYKCAFGDIETEHYDSKESARIAYEQNMQSQTTRPAKRSEFIQSSEKFQEVLQNYDSENPKTVSIPKDSEYRVQSEELLKSLDMQNSSGDRYFVPGSIRVHIKPGSISVTAKHADIDEDVYFYANRISGHAFYGDNPQGHARDDYTFRTVFGKIENTQSIDSITDTMLDLYEQREGKDGKWDSDIESIKFNYVNFGHFEINEALRSGKGLNDEYISSLDTISQENALDKEVIVYRGVPRQVAKTYIDKIVRGEGLSDPALMSTTIDPSLAKKFASKDGYVFQIHLPKGQKCLDLSEDGNEGEILLPRNTKLDKIQIFDLKG